MIYGKTLSSKTKRPVTQPTAHQEPPTVGLTVPEERQLWISRRKKCQDFEGCMTDLIAQNLEKVCYLNNKMLNKEKTWRKLPENGIIALFEVWSFLNYPKTR